MEAENLASNGDVGNGECAAQGANPMLLETNASKTSQPLIARQTQQAVTLIQYLASGMYLPLFTDKVRNNVRNRAVLIGVYAISAAFVCLLVVLAFSMDTKVTWTAQFSTTPPTTAYVGEPLPLFSFQVLDSNHRGVEGQPVFAFVTPVNEVDLTVTLQEGTLVSRAIMCIESISSAYSGSQQDDVGICNPASYMTLRNAVAVTNSRGVAKFTNFTIGYAVATTYVLVVGLQNYPSTYQTQYINVQTRVQNIVINTRNGGIMDTAFLTTLGFPMPIVDRNTWSNLHNATFNFSVTVEFIPSPEFSASYSLADTMAEANEAANFFGVTVPPIVGDTILPSLLKPKIPYICASVVSLDMQKPGYNTPPGMVQPLLGPEHKSVQFINQTVCTAEVVRGNKTSTSGDRRVFYATLTFEQFGIVGTNTPMMFLGVSAMGMIVPLPFRGIASPKMTPNQLLLSGTPQTQVANVIATCSSCIDNNENIPEGVSIGNVQVTVQDSAGTPLPGRIVCLFAKPSRRNNVTQGTGALLIPQITPKSVKDECAFAGANGVANLSNAFFSASGTAGIYDLFVVCDGVAGYWSDIGQTQGDFFNSRRPVHVTTSVVVVETAFISGSPDRSVEYVGEPWLLLPVFRVARSIQPLVAAPGKIVNVVAAERHLYATTAKSIQTSDDGIALLVSMVVHTTTSTAADFQQPKNVSFEVQIDGVAFSTFWRLIAPPRNFTWQNTTVPLNVSDGNDTRTTVVSHGPCAFVRLLSKADVALTGIPYYMLVQSVDALNNPVPYANVSLEVDPKFVPPPPGKTSYQANFTTGADGKLNVPPNFNLLPGAFSFYGMMYCSSQSTAVSPSGTASNAAVNYAAFALVPRVNYVEFVDNTQANYMAIKLHLNQDPDVLATISPQLPISVTAIPTWYPSYVVNFFTSAQFPVATMTSVSNLTQANFIVITFDQRVMEMFPSGPFGYVVQADNTFFNPFVTGVIPPLPHTIQIASSIFWSSVGVNEVSLGKFSRNPSIRLLQADGVTPVKGKFLFAQLAIVLANGTRVYQDVFSRVTDLAYGGIVAISSNSVEKPISSQTDVNGYATFANLSLVGLQGGAVFSVRYCVGINIFSSLNFSAAATEACVDEVGTATVPFTENLQFVPNTLTISGTPGRLLPPITINAKTMFGSSPSAMMCAPFLKGVPTSYLTFDRNLFLSQFQAYGTFYTMGGSLSIENSITVSEMVPPGAYTLTFVCSGNTATPIAIIISSSPALIKFTIPPPSVFAITQIVPVQVALLSQSAAPLSNELIELSIQSTAPANNCTGFVCGHINGASKLFATTDVFGNALFFYVVDASQQCQMEVTARLASSTSQNAVRQSTSAQLNSLAALYGTPISATIATVLAKNPIVAAIFVISENILNEGRSSATVGNGGTFIQGGAVPHASNATSSSSESDATGYTSPIQLLMNTFGVGSSTKISTSASVAVFNPAISGEWVSPPQLLPLYTLPTTVTSVVADANIVPLTIDVATNCPVIRFTDSNGLPVSGLSLTPDVVSDDSNGNAYFTMIDETLTDFNGTVTACFTVKFYAPALYSLRFSANGGGFVLSAPIQVNPSPAVSRMEYMKILAAFLVLFFSPMLMASVPHSRWWYNLVACLVTLTAGAVGIAADKLIQEQYQQPLYHGYMLFIIVTAFTVAGVVIFWTVIDTVAYKCFSLQSQQQDEKYERFTYIPWSEKRAKGLREEEEGEETNLPLLQRLHRMVPQALMNLRFTNDEDKAFRTIKYCAWILNIRLYHQRALWKKLQKAKVDRLSNRAKLFKYEVQATAMNKVNSLVQYGVFDKDSIDVKMQRRRRRDRQTELIYTPSESFDPTYTPINFLIVVGISVVLLITLNFITVYEYEYILSKLNALVSYLPTIDSPEQEALVKEVNYIVVFSLTETIRMIVDMFPQFSNLSALIGPLSKIDVVTILSTIREYVAAGLVRLQISFWVAGSVALIAFVATLVTTWIEIPKLVRKIRRGQVQVPSSISSIESYIGMHCLQMIIMHQLVFWPLTIIVFVLSVGPIRVFLWDKLYVIILAALLSYLSQTLVQKFIIAFFLTKGSFTVVAPEFYSIWHFAGLILGIFSGLVKSAIRWATCLGLVSALFARLDQAIYPALFASLDRGHTGFQSVIAVEAKNGNPLYILFSTILLMNANMYRIAKERSDAMGSLRLAVDDTLFADDACLASSIKNCARILVRRLATIPRPHNLKIRLQLEQELCKAPLVMETAIRRHGKSKEVVLPLVSINTDQQQELNILDPCSATPLVGSDYNRCGSPLQEGGFKPYFDLVPFVEKSDRVRREKIRNRFWMWMILTLNPSLVQYRKHQLYVYNEGAIAQDSEEDATNLTDGFLL